jgi:hypothetical protein
MVEREVGNSESMTITEALAEVPLAKKKIDQAESNILRYLARPDDRKDPHAEDGGSKKYVQSQLQAIEDTLSRLIRIRMSIAKANSGNKVTVGSQALNKEYTKTIEAWLIWRREVYPYQKRLYEQMTRRIDDERKGDRKTAVGLDTSFGARRQIQAAKQFEYPGKADVTVEYDEKHLSVLIEGLEEVNGILDGRLTLFNSTVEIKF